MMMDMTSRYGIGESVAGMGGSAISDAIKSGTPQKDLRDGLLWTSIYHTASAR